MSLLVVNALFDADACEIMGSTIFSTNPRELVTIEQLEKIMDRNDIE